MDITKRIKKKPMSRVARTCKILSVLCMIAFALVVLWCVAVLIFICYSIISSNTGNNLSPASIALPFVFLLYMANASLLPLILSKMLGDLSESRTPFTLKNASRLKWLGYVLVLYTVLEWLLAMVNSQFILAFGDGAFKIGNLISSFSSSAGTMINLFPFVIAAVFFALSYVFKYGVLLQQESDETL